MKPKAAYICMALMYVNPALAEPPAAIVREVCSQPSERRNFENLLARCPADNNARIFSALMEKRFGYGEQRSVSAGCTDLVSWGKSCNFTMANRSPPDNRPISTQPSTLRQEPASIERQQIVVAPITPPQNAPPQKIGPLNGRLNELIDQERKPNVPVRQALTSETTRQGYEQDDCRGKIQHGQPIVKNSCNDGADGFTWSLQVTSNCRRSARVHIHGTERSPTSETTRNFKRSANVPPSGLTLEYFGACVDKPQIDSATVENLPYDR